MTCRAPGEPQPCTRHNCASLQVVNLTLPSHGRVESAPRLAMAWYDIPTQTKCAASRNGDSLLDLASGTGAVMCCGACTRTAAPGAGAVGASASRAASAQATSAAATQRVELCT